MSRRICSRCRDLSFEGSATYCSNYYHREECPKGGGAIVVVVVCPDSVVDATHNALAGIARSYSDDCGIANAVGVYHTCLHSEAGGGHGTSVTSVSHSWTRPAQKSWNVEYGDYQEWCHGLVLPADHWHGNARATVFLAAMRAEEVATWCLEAAQCAVEPVCMLRYADSGTHLDKVRQLIPLLAASAMERYQAFQQCIADRKLQREREWRRDVELAMEAERRLIMRITRDQY